MFDNMDNNKAVTEDIFASVDDVGIKPVQKPQQQEYDVAQYVDEDEGFFGQNKKIFLLAGAVVLAFTLMLSGWLLFGKIFKLSPNVETPIVQNQEMVNKQENPAIDNTKAANDQPADQTVVNNSKTNSSDSDGDGLSDEEEATIGTDKTKVDTDGDGLYDRDEVRVYKSDPLKIDTDGDGASDGLEVKNGDNPNGDGKLYDSAKRYTSGQVDSGSKISDSDNDGLTDDEEAMLGTDKQNKDSDNDGISDFDEIKKYQTSPLRPDTDGDGYNDGVEVQKGFNPSGQGKLIIK